MQSVVSRLQCELVDLIKTERGPNDPANWRPYDHRLALLGGNYQVVADLELNVTNSGELSPSFTYSTTNIFGIDAGLKYSRSRTDQFSQEMIFSIPDLNRKWKKDHSFGQCPLSDTNLAGDLGVENKVTLGVTTPYAVQSDKKLFGGSIEFDVIRNINGVGPTWTLAHFEGPGKLLTIERENKDTLTLAFSKVDDPSNASEVGAATDAAKSFVNDLTIKRLANAIGRL
ncbi:hypothetical protein RFM41_10320 [Mesorhizobium sp. VK25A]|uniref:Uncharacterized protein n=1 Tax=Mesorhizobium vachelliae TaxID=3072309 RepID=A0ABU5A0F7_9HYPH|nr:MULTISPECIES: hypothetical protein [unclassified Mesorhizobium]MDX8529738.1 hypothetical protein [Mesorhizobium sp. VK25D]MDX8544136.1 hypothetical protein [Mesorhizobium sp. VK25A]